MFFSRYARVFFSLHKLVVRVVSTILGLVGTSLHGTERSQHSVLVVFLVGFRLDCVCCIVTAPGVLRAVGVGLRVLWKDEIED